jgi:hypothetical protein
LPDAAGPSAHEKTAGGQRMTRRDAHVAATRGSRGRSSELAFVNDLSPGHPDH